MYASRTLCTAVRRNGPVTPTAESLGLDRRGNRRGRESHGQTDLSARYWWTWVYINAQYRAGAKRLKDPAKFALASRVAEAPA